MTHFTFRLTAKNQDQLWNPTLGNPVWAIFTFLLAGLAESNHRLRCRTPSVTINTRGVRQTNRQNKRYGRASHTLGNPDDYRDSDDVIRLKVVSGRPVDDARCLVGSRVRRVASCRVGSCLFGIARASAAGWAGLQAAAVSRSRWLLPPWPRRATLVRRRRIEIAIRPLDVDISQPLPCSYIRSVLVER